MGKRSAHAKKEQPSSSKGVGGFSHVKKGRLVWLSLLLLAILVAGTVLIWPQKGGVPIFAPLVGDTRQVGCKQEGASLTTTDLLAMSDDDLERMSLIEMNLVVARDLPECKNLDIAACEQAVNAWVENFRQELPKAEALFRLHPERYKDDLDFFRFGLVMDYMGGRLKMVYDPKLIRVPGGAKYTDPKNLFVHGLIEDRQGTCGNMPVIQAAMARKLGWPVALVPVQGHCFCRWDDGKKHLNIETTQTDKGGFSAATDEEYAAREGITADMQKTSLELHTLTARQMLGIFIMYRGRLWFDRGENAQALRDFKLASTLIPKHRVLLEMLGEARRRMTLWVNPMSSSLSSGDRIGSVDVEQINRENRENQARIRAEIEQAGAINNYTRRRLNGQLREGEQPPIFNSPSQFPVAPRPVLDPFGRPNQSAQ